MCPPLPVRGQRNKLVTALSPWFTFAWSTSQPVNRWLHISAGQRHAKRRTLCTVRNQRSRSTSYAFTRKLSCPSPRLQTCALFKVKSSRSQKERAGHVASRLRREAENWYGWPSGRSTTRSRSRCTLQRARIPPCADGLTIAMLSCSPSVRVTYGGGTNTTRNG